jgi:putative sugar O-methyltransferase
LHDYVCIISFARLTGINQDIINPPFTMNRDTNILEEPHILDLMTADMDKAPELYKPTNYWQYKEAFMMPSLKSEGLKDFRRKRMSVFASFGGIDVYPPCWIDLRKSRLLNNRLVRWMGPWQSMLLGLSKIVDTIASVVAPGYIKYLKEKPYRVAKEAEKKNGSLPVENFEASLVANPEYVFEVNGKVYTNNIFEYYLRYSYCCRFMDFSKVKVIVELGSGSCKLTEVIRKLHPHIAFLNFDISPQLYVGQMYLKSVFPNDVVGYEENRNLTAIAPPEPGKIYFYGSWQFPLLKDFSYDLFMNLTSFQEMEPHVVANYASFINGNSPYVFLHEQMAGKEVAQKEGDFGVLEPTKLEHYIKAFDKYDLVNAEDSRKETGEFKWAGHKESFWVRKS